MPAMRLGAADHVVQPAVAQAQVAVLEEAVHGVQQEIAADHLGSDAEQQERHAVAGKLQDLLERVKPADVERVQDVGRVVDLVQTPERRVRVAGAMHPVAHEVDREQHHHHLDPERPVVRPPGVRSVLVHPLRDRKHHQDGESARQQDLHERHERGVGRDVGALGTPFEPLREPQLENHDDERGGQDGQIGCQQERHAGGEHGGEGRDRTREEQRIPEVRQRAAHGSSPVVGAVPRR